MKKFFAAAVLLAAMAAMGGCSLKKTDKAEEITPTSAAETTSSAENTTAVTEPSSQEKATEPPRQNDDVLKAEAGKYVYDLAHLMTDEQKKSCEEYLDSLYREYMLNAAVVTAGDLKDKPPYTYAAEAYFTIYGGEGNGLLLLINNDTNEDFLYKTGTCTHNISTGAEKNAFFTATRDIVNGDYDAAVKELMGLGEKCSRWVFDEAEAFSVAEIADIDKLLADKDTPAAIAAVRSGKSGKDVQTLAEELFTRHFKDGKGIMIAIDTTSKKTAAYSPEPLPEELNSALKKADESAAKGEWANAAKTAAESVPEKTETAETTASETTAENPTATETTATVTTSTVTTVNNN